MGQHGLRSADSGATMTCMVTADELRQLDDAFRSSPRDFNAALDGLLQEQPDHARRIRHRLRQVHLSVADTQRLSHGEAAFGELGTLLHVAGAGPAMRRLRDKHQDVLPGHPYLHVPDAPWVRENETPSAHSPIRQVQACLVILTDINPAVTAWARDLARRRLVDLLLDHPILLHERFVWTVRVRVFIQVPLLHVMTLAPHASLPSPAFDIEPGRLRAFAVHPLLAHATRAKSPRLAKTALVRALQGRSFFSLVHRRQWPLFFLGYALLCLDRLRTQEEAAPTLCSSTPDGRAAMLLLAGRTLFDHWDKPRPHSVGERFMAEVSTARCLPSAALRTLVLARAPSIFVETNDRRAPLVAAPDALERYDRLCQLLLAAGWAESPVAAARLVIGGIFAVQASSGMPSAAIDHASVDVTTALVDRWRRQGIQATELMVLTRHAGPAWSRALSAARQAYGLSTFH